MTSLPELQDDLPSNWSKIQIDPDYPIDEIFLWTGTTGTTAPMHYDMGYNFHFQLEGKKKFYVAAFSEYPKVNYSKYP